jgi:hypothetical protein
MRLEATRQIAGLHVSCRIKKRTLLRAQFGSGERDQIVDGTAR